MPYDNNLKGSLWIKTGDDGSQYLGGSVEVLGVEYWVSVSKNDKKAEGSSQPDYRMIFKPKQAGASTVDPTQVAPGRHTASITHVGEVKTSKAGNTYAAVITDLGTTVVGEKELDSVIDAYKGSTKVMIQVSDKGWITGVMPITQEVNMDDIPF